MNTIDFSPEGSGRFQPRGIGEISATRDRGDFRLGALADFADFADFFTTDEHGGTLLKCDLGSLIGFMGLGIWLLG
ncbi:hypothetical protein SAMN05421761_11837 [Belliella pelovolcani]|uniref:Uncharacterized protein n=1 Tax=Belliella pelovolcani TaxID=529505 RepID=A0A1N7PN45_9BACT|nr:hypothetical protein SAMN05421761_11837 [Belliella pelovolcani]